MRRIAAVVVALCAIRGPCHAADSAPDPAAITVSHIQAGVLSAHAQRQALRIEYRWKNPKRQPTQADGHVRRVVAANRRGPAHAWIARNSGADLWVSPVTYAEVVEGAEDAVAVREAFRAFR